MSQEYILKRKLCDQLLEWKRTACGKSAVMVEGARRVGKSTVVKAFAAAEYDDYLLLDFSTETAEVLENFRNIGRLDTFFRNLFLLKGKELPKRRAAIIFDNVQLFPRRDRPSSRLSLTADTTTSRPARLSPSGRTSQTSSFPPRSASPRCTPLDFEEFLWATGNTVVAPAIRDAFATRNPLGDMLHKRFMEDFRAYMVVEGMPQAVAAYASGATYQQIERVKREILARYEGDLEKYDEAEGARASAVFRSIPAQLSHRNARFRYATVGTSARATNVRSALEYLRKSMMCNLCTNVTVPEVALDLYEDSSQFKLFMGDTGLLLTQVIGETPEVGEALQRGLIAGKLGVNMGIIMENAVAQALVASGHGLHFHAFERTFEGKPVPYEVDFLLVRGNRVVPVKVKSSGYRRHASLDQFFDKYGVGRAESYVLTPKDLSREGNLTYIPLYMSMCL